MGNLTTNPREGHGFGTGRSKGFGAGKVDPVAAGRLGGQVSGLSRRLRAQRVLEERIASSRNGAAIFALYRVQLERQQALEAERIRLDDQVIELGHWVTQERELLAELHADRERLDAERVELEQRVHALTQRLQSDADLDALLAEVGSARVEASAERLGWFDDDSEETDDASSVQQQT